MAYSGSTCRRSTMENSSSIYGNNPVSNPVNASVATSSRRTNIEAIESSSTDVNRPRTSASITGTWASHRVEPLFQDRMAVQVAQSDKERLLPDIYPILDSINLDEITQQLRELSLEFVKGSQVNIIMECIRGIRNLHPITDAPLEDIDTSIRLPRVLEGELIYLKTTGNGNCLYNAVSQILFGTENYQKHIRLLVAVIILSHRTLFEQYISKTHREQRYEDYVLSALSDTAWASDIHIHAITICLRRPVTVIGKGLKSKCRSLTSFLKQTESNNFQDCFTYSFNEISLTTPTPIYILFSNSNHFSAVLARTDVKIFFRRFMSRYEIDATDNLVAVASLNPVIHDIEISSPDEIRDRLLQKAAPQTLSKAAIRMRKMRENEEHYNLEKQKNAERNRLNREHSKDDYDKCVVEYQKAIEEGPTHVCCCCNNLWFKHSVTRTTKSVLVSLNSKCSAMKEDSGEICNTCKSKLQSGDIPAHSSFNGVKFVNIPEELRLLSSLEETLVSPRIPFMTIRNIGCDRQFGLKGAVVNVPTEVDKTISSIPRAISDLQVIEVNLKRKLEYKHSYCSAMIRPTYVFEAASFLCNQPLYLKHEISYVGHRLTGEQVSPQKEESHQMSETVDDSDEECLNPGSTETLLCQPDFRINLAPGEGKIPLNVLYDVDCEALCFPTVYCGQEDPFKHLSVCDRVKFKARHVDRRCAKVPVLFFMYKLQEASRLSQIIGICIRRQKQQRLCADDCLNGSFLANMFLEDNAYEFLKSLRSSPAYWESKKKDVFAMIRQLGLPTLFMTFSAAESKWGALLVILKKVIDHVDITMEDAKAMKYEEKARLIRSDPITCARYFENKFRNFMFKILLHKNGIFKKYPILDYYVRFEFQHRGSVHAHMVVWLKNAPVFIPGNQESIDDCSQFIDLYSSCQKESVNEELIKYQIHKHSFSCRKHNSDKCRFNIPLFPMRKTTLLEPLETDIPRKSIRRKLKSLQLLLESKPFSDIDEFLKDAKLGHDEYIALIRKSLCKPKVFLKRQPCEHNVNPFNPELLSLYQANMDIQFITDAYACVSYVVDYINKSNRGMSAMLRELSNNLRNQPIDSLQKIRVIASKFVNATEISAQEAAYHVLELPLTMSSRTVEYINTGNVSERVRLLKPRKTLEELDPDSEDVYAANCLHHYSNRPQSLENLCLADFVANYTYATFRKTSNYLKLENGDGFVCKRKVNKVLRYRRYSSQDMLNYYRELLTLFHPWRDEAIDVLNTDVEAVFLANQGSILQKRQDYEHPGCDLSQIDLDQRSISDSEDESSQAMDYAALHKPLEMVPDMNQKRETNTVTFKRYELVETNFRKTILNLNKKQYNYIISLWNNLFTDTKIFHFISGGAGTGKSVLIQAIAAVVEKFYKLKDMSDVSRCRSIITAPTGRAAFNVQGYTLHTALMIPVSANDNNFGPLGSDTLNRVRSRMYGMKFLIIDEISMVGASLFEKVHLRLQQIFQSNEPFGGISVIVVGDFHQLSPVCDRFVFLPNPQNPYAYIAGNPLWKPFQYYKLTEIMRQKDDAVFAEVLERFANNNLLDTDIHLLQSRVGKEPPTTAIHLFHTNADVNEFNLNRLNTLQTEGIINNAVDSCFGEAPEKVRNSFIQSLKNSKPSETQGLLTTLILRVSAKYMITENIDVEDGLVNGSVGTLEKISYNDAHTRAVVAWMRLDKTAGIQQRIKYKHLQIGYSNLTPIFAVNKLITNKGRSRNLRLFRKQFPLAPAEGMTVYKSQGGTYQNIVYHTKSTRSHAACYVALSRVTSLDGLYIDGPLSTNFNGNTKVTEALKLLSSKPAAYQFDHLLIRNNFTLKVVSFNIQSFVLNNDFINRDDHLINSDLLCLTETWTTPSDMISFYGFETVGRLDSGCRRKPSGIIVLSKPGLGFKQVKAYRSINQGYAIDSVLVMNAEYAVLTVYAAPKSTISDLQTHLACTMHNIDRNVKLLVAGDFNQNLLYPATKQRIHQMISNLKCQLIAPKLPSTIAGTQIDFAFGTVDMVTTEYYESMVSFHRPQIITVECKRYRFLRIISMFTWLTLLCLVLYQHKTKYKWLVSQITKRNIQPP